MQLADVGLTAGTGRGAEGEEVHVGPVRDLAVVGGETEPAGLRVLLQQWFQPVLEDV